MLTRFAKVQAQLEQAQDKKLIVQFARSCEAGTMTGFVGEVGPKFFQCALLNDGLEFENYSFIRVRDVRRLQVPAAHFSFYTAARKLRGDKMPKKLRTPLSDANVILQSLAGMVVTVFRERIDPEVCLIGKVISGNDSYLELLEIDADGQWETKASFYRHREITRIDLPGPYEKALLLVAEGGRA